MMGDHLPILIVVIPLMSAFLVPLAGSLRREVSFILTVGALAGSFVCSLGTLTMVLRGTAIHYWLGGWQPP